MDPSSDEEDYNADSPEPLEDDNQDEFLEDEIDSRRAAPRDGAPKYTIPPRVLGAVEIPAVVENVDRAVKAFGRTPTFHQVSELTSRV